MFDSSITIGAVALASLVHFALGELFAGRTPFLILLLAVMLSAVRGGLWQGLLATLLGLMIEISVWGDWGWFIPDSDSPHFIEIALFLLEGALISWLGDFYLNGQLALRHSFDGGRPANLSDLVEARVAVRTTELANRVAELRSALEKVTGLSGILPICGTCKRIRDDEGEWTQVEDFISARSSVEFSHSLCPDCLSKLRSEISERQRRPGEDPPR